MKVGVVTSSRADFGIYLPLLKKLQTDSFFTLKLIVFGTHLSKFHGYTVTQIIEEGFSIDYTVESILLHDSSDAVATSTSLTMMKFSQFWKEHSKDFDIVLCLGDRYEMFAAVMAGVPFNIKFAHIHGGEKTLGAIDNIFRHAISHAAWCHFTSTEGFAERLKLMLDVSERIYNVGALSLDNINSLELYTKEEFYSKWKIDLNNPTVLATFHPETVAPEKNEYYAKQIVGVFKQLNNFQVILTLPNADTAGNTIRDIFIKELSNQPNIFLIENFGTKGYFTAIKYCSFLLGNSSSGIIEAASFGKYVVNIGDRQKGRLQSSNVISVSIKVSDIIEACYSANEKLYEGENIYQSSTLASDSIIKIMKEFQSYA